MSRSAPFSELFFSRLDRVRAVLDLYITCPSEENIHDVRTSIRRLESAYSVLSKSNKTKKSDRLISMYGDFFALNSTIRDHDVILKKLEEYGHDSESKASLITRKNKLKKLSGALDLAEDLSKSKRIKLKKPKSAKRKFKKKVLALINGIRESVLVVTRDESLVDELHQMRKTVKKLRYVLELSPDNTYDDLIVNLKLLQGMLGDIHDCDVFVRYIEKNRKEFPDMSGDLASEKEKRGTLYKRLVLALDGY